jgi:phosphatidyl-myo-inositol dimannoside synthase
MKKTLIITLEYPPQVGGIATYVYDLASTFDQNKTVVLAPKMKNTKEWDDSQSYIVVRKSLLFPKFLWPRWTRLLWHTFRIVRKEKIEIILVHHVLPVGYAALFIKKFLKIPFLLFSHGTDLVAGTKSPWKKSRVAQVSAASEQVIFNSESLKHRFLRALPTFEDMSLVMYPCPNSKFLEEPEESVLEDLRNTYALHGKQVLLTVSRFVDGKGFPHLLRMMPKILKQIPHLVWILVGDGPKKEYILATIQKGNLQNIVRFVGELPHDELKNFYYLADLFVLLTHPDEGREEGLGMVFLEAAAAGLPVVAGKSGGVEEAVLHGKTGIIIDLYKGDPAVIKTIVDGLRDKAFAIKLGRSAKERIQHDFVWEKQVKLLEPWIGSLASQGRSPAFLPSKQKAND